MGPDILRDDLVQRAHYAQGAGIYRIIPAAVGRPHDLFELRALLDRARQTGWSVTPRGAGSAMDGSNLGEGLMLDLTAFDAARCLVDATSRRAEVSPGLSWRALDLTANRHGLRLPPDPSSGAWATLGGMVSTNASGARSFRFGSIRPWVEALTLLTDDAPLHLARGITPDVTHPVIERWRTQVEPLLAEPNDLLRSFPAVTKNSAGYALDRYLRSGDLIDLVIGAEGTLGIVTDLTLRLDPVPPARASLRILVTSRESLVPAIDALRPHLPSTVEFLDRSFLRLVDPRLAGDAMELLPRIGGAILADFEGEDATQVQHRVEGALRDAAPWMCDGLIATTPGDIDALWQIRHGASPALARLRDGRRSLQIIEDGAVPPEQLAHYLDAIEAACAAEGIDVVLFGHAGDGHVHANLLPNLDDPLWEERVARIYHGVTDAVLRLGGTPSGEHGAGRLRNGILERLYGPRVLAVFEAVKAAFDPARRFNPGILLPSADPPFSRLKVGRSAPDLPADLAQYLLDIEQRAGWGEDRWIDR